MTIPTTYAELKTEVLNWLNRPELTSDVATFISFGEADINLVSRLSQQETTAAVTTTSSQNYTNLPTGFLEHISLVYDGDLYEQPEKVDLLALDAMRVRTSGSGSVPTHFAISNSRYEWNYSPDAVYSLTSRHYKKWNIASDLTNWLLTNYPMAYLYTSLVHAATFIRHPNLATWQAMAKDAVDKIEYQSTKLKKANLTVDAGLIGAGQSNIFSGE